jgi:hypothetical protein
MNSLKKFIPKRIKKSVKWWVFQQIFYWKLRQYTPVFIFQMGKVGSMSIHDSLLDQYPGSVIQAHGLSLKQEKPELKCLHRWTISTRRPIKRKLKIITLVREPIGRNVSWFFQNFKEYTGSTFGESNFTIEELRNIFLSNFDHELPLEWFDRNIENYFGIDVYSKPFSESGHEIYDGGYVTLLVLKLEIDDKTKYEVIQEFLGINSFSLKNVNIGFEKDYGKTYKEFQQLVKLPDQYLQKMCTSKYFKHFYSQQEIDVIRKKWKKMD